MTMRLLSIAPYKYLPARKGGEVFIANYNAHLSRFCGLTVVSVEANEPEAHLPYALWRLFSNSRSRYLNVFYCRTLAQEVREKEMQLLQIEHPYMGWMAIVIQALTGRGYVVHSHNLEATRWRSLGKWWWPLLQAYEKWVHRKAKHSFFISQEDADTAIRLYRLSPERVSIAPYAITQEPPAADRELQRQRVFARHQVPEGSALYYFNGALDYLPNQQAVLRIIEVLDPLLQKAQFPYVIMISGKGLPEAIIAKIAGTNGRIMYVGFVDSPAEYLVAADMFINPVVEGGGVKTKVLEALAAHKTVISTASGAAGVDPALCGPKLQIVPDQDWPQFAASMQQLSEVNTPTPREFFQYHNPERIAREAVMHMESILAGRDR